MVIHQMDAFAGAIGVSDSDGKGTPLSTQYVIQPSTPSVLQCACRPRNGTQSMDIGSWAREYASGLLTSGIRSSPSKHSLSHLSPSSAAIVRYLDHVDRRIRRYVSAKRKLIALLEEEKQAVVNRAVTRGLDPNVRLKPSGVEWLGDVPEHWEVQRAKFFFREAGTIHHWHRGVDVGIPHYGCDSQTTKEVRHHVSGRVKYGLQAV